MRAINLNKSVYEVCEKYPEVKNILLELGFVDINKPGMLQTVGRFMSIEKGARMKKIDLELIKIKFYENNFEIIKGDYNEQRN